MTFGSVLKKRARIDKAMSSQSVSKIDLIALPFHALIILIGTFGNALVITVVRTTKTMHTTINFLLVNLAVADLLTLLWLIPAEVFKFLDHPGGHLGNFLCKFITRNSLPMVTLSVSGVTLTVISLERYHALLRPMNTRFRLRIDNVKYVIAGIWLFCIVVLTPFAFFMKYDEHSQSCRDNWGDIPGGNLYFAFLALPMVISLLIICFCYFKLIKEVYFSNTIMSESAATSENDNRSKRKIVKLLFILTAVFLICFAPYISSVLIYAAASQSPELFYKISLSLMYSNSCVNPVICAFQSANYRSGFKRLLCGWREKGRVSVQNGGVRIEGQESWPCRVESVHNVIQDGYALKEL